MIICEFLMWILTANYALCDPMRYYPTLGTRYGVDISHVKMVLALSWMLSTQNQLHPLIQYYSKHENKLK